MPKSSRAVPNYFVAARTNGPEVQEVMRRVGDSLVEVEPALSKALVSKDKAHLTVLVLCLATDEEVEAASAALRSFSSLSISTRTTPRTTEETSTSTREANSSSCLTFAYQGLGTFHDKVVYMDVSEEHKERVVEVFKEVRNHFVTSKVAPERLLKETVTPHLTVAKLSKMRNNNSNKGENTKKINGIPRHAWEGFKPEEVAVKEVRVETLELCSMQGSIGPDGFYEVIETVRLDGGRNEGTEGNLVEAAAASL